MAMTCELLCVSSLELPEVCPATIINASRDRASEIETVLRSTTMGKCISRSTSAAKDEDAANEPKDEVKNNSAEAKAKNEKTANGQLDTNRADETHEEPDSNATSTADAKTESTSKETKSTKETKTVRITETKTSEVNVERQKSDDPVQSTKPEDIAVDLNDPEVQKAATTIQAGFRGHQTRKQLKSSPDNHQESANDLDIDLNDPEVNKAAVKIQSSFRGHIARKNMQNN